MTGRGAGDGAARPRPAPLRVLGFGTYDVRSHPRVGVLLDGLRERGHRVRERDEPLGLSTAERVALLHQPWRLGVLAARLADRWTRLGLARRAFTGEHAPDAVVMGYLGHFDVLLARALWPRRGTGAGTWEGSRSGSLGGRAPGTHAPTLVLDHLIFAAGTAADRGAGDGLRTRLLRRLDAAALRAADVILLDTEEHRTQARATLDAHGGTGERSLLVAPVGAPRTWFAARQAESGAGAGAATPTDGADGAGAATARAPSAAATADAGAAPLRVVFYGLFTPLQGTPTLAAALRTLADAGTVDLDVTLVGGGQDEAEVRALLGVGAGDHDRVPLGAGRVRLTWRAWVDAEELPALVAEHDVCVGILGTTPKAFAVVPNKAYQGAAAGCAILTSDTPPQRRAFGQAAVYVEPGDATGLATALSALAADRPRLARLRAAAAERADLAFSPHAVTATLDAELRARRRGLRALP